MSRSPVSEARPPVPAVAEYEWSSLLEEIVLDRHSQIPPVEQIQSAIRHRLATGRVQVGARMPSARKLAAALGVTSATVGRAYAALQDESLLTATVGVGTTVADVGDLGLAARTQMQRQGVATLLEAIKSMRATGLSTPDITTALHAALESLSDTLTVVVVGARGSSVDHHAMELRRALQDLPVTINQVILEDLTDGQGEATRTVMGCDLIITTLVYQRHVTRLLGADAPPVTVLMSELSPRTTKQLLAIGEDDRILLLCKPLSRSIALGIIQSHGLREQLEVATDLDLEHIRADHPDIDVYVHTTDLKHLVADLGTDARTIPLRIVLRPESVSQLRDYLMHSVGAHPAP